MTIQQFAEIKQKSVRTVRAWINKGFIPGASIEGDYVPNSARIPYTLTRARKGTALLNAIMRACGEERGISPAIFKLTPERFEIVLTSLENEGMISSFEMDGIIYYDLTIMGREKLQVFKPSDWIALGTLIAAAAPSLLHMLF